MRYEEEEVGIEESMLWRPYHIEASDTNHFHIRKRLTWHEKEEALDVEGKAPTSTCRIEGRRKHVEVKEIDVEAQKRKDISLDQ
jgi:uncharacterized protein YxjI